MNKYSAAERRRALRELLASPPAGGQEALASALRRKGFRTTQATLSRDLQEIGAVRIRTGPRGYRYEIVGPATPGAGPHRLREVFHQFVIEIRSTGALILVKTTPGNAAGVASLIDAWRNPAVLGTVAGDDTVLVVVDGEPRRPHVEQQLRSLL